LAPRGLWLAALAGLLAAPAALPAQALPRETLTRLKQATVFVKVDAARWGARGTGFLIRVDGETGYLVTNDHVIRPDSPRAGSARLSVVFGGGTPAERTVPARIAATDASRDLAILKVEGVKDLPKPLDLAARAELVETMPVYVFGFPLGEMLATGKGSPAITVGRGSVSSVRLDEYGRTSVVQIDGELNPGNSGGPVVDGEGRLVGVAVARVIGTRIGLAVPPEQLRRMLLGRVGAVGFHTQKVEKGQAELRVEATLIDPMDKLREVAIAYGPESAAAGRLKPNADGTFPPLPGADTRVPLKLEGGKGSAVFTAPAEGPTGGKFAFQTIYVDGEGRTVRTQASRFEVSRDQVAGGAGVKPAKPTGPAGSTVPLGDAPGGVTANDARQGASRTVDDLTVTEVRLNAAALAPCLVWARDGKSFYALEGGTGMLRRIALDGFREVQRLDVGRKCGWLSLSAEGLVVTVTDAQEVWLVDAEQLKVKGRCAVASVTRAVSAPGLSVAVAASPGPLDGGDLYVLDLKKVDVVKAYKARDFSRDVGFDRAVMTPDGKYLFTAGGIEQMARFRIDGADLVFEQSSYRIAQGAVGAGICVSPDGRFVCYPTGGGNYGVGENHPPRQGYSTWIYPVTNLRKPALQLETGPYPRAVGFDPKAGRIFGQNFDTTLMVFNEAGIKRKVYQFGSRGDEVKQFSTHPDGGKLLLLTGSKLFWIEFPSAQ
jgi:S1-C subfamily serine protease